MTKTIFTYGLIAGFVIITTFVIGTILSRGEDAFAIGEVVGYLIMLVALSMIFVGTKRYRDRELGGVIKFGRAFLVGLGISAVASVIYVGAWEVNLAMTDYAFIEDYTAFEIAKKKESGIAGAELEKVIAEMNEVKANYGKLAYRLPMTFSEIFPVGLLVSLISALILRNSNILPVTA